MNHWNSPITMHRILIIVGIILFSAGVGRTLIGF